jgi:uncharacterized protein YndB with AHSA1/START domain
MADILHRVYIRTDPTKLYEAISTQEGLKSWWTPHTKAESTTGSVATFRFEDDSMGPDMKILDLVANELVRWECVGGIEDWIGTTLEFSIRPHKEGALLLFAQRDWKEPSEFYMHCNCKWAFFLGVSLKTYLEEQRGMPYPHDPDF